MTRTLALVLGMVLCTIAVAQATPTGWNHLVYSWALRDPLPVLPIPLLGADQAQVDLGRCFAVAYDRIAADDEVDYTGSPPAPPLRKSEGAWMGRLLRERGLRIVLAAEEPDLSRLLLADHARQVRAAEAGIEAADHRAHLAEHRAFLRDGEVAHDLQDVAAADGKAVD